MQKYKVVVSPSEDGREECLVIKADAHDTGEEVFTIWTLDKEFGALKNLDPFGPERVFEIAEDLSFRASGIVDEPRAERLVREINRLTERWSCLFCPEFGPFDENEWAKRDQKSLDEIASRKRSRMN
jgi:hypothetical protein